MNTVQKDIHRVKIDISHSIEYIWIQFKQPPQSTANEVNIFAEDQIYKNNVLSHLKLQDKVVIPVFQDCNAFHPQWLQKYLRESYSDSSVPRKQL